LLLAFGALTAIGVAAIAAYPWTDSRWLFMGAPALQGFGAAGVTLLVCLAAVRAAGRSPLVAALPSLTIMLGTECGLELLQLVFAGAQAGGLPVADAYQALFAAQLLCALVALALLGRAVRRPEGSAPE
jgi:hypothetical protein